MHTARIVHRVRGQNPALKTHRGPSRRQKRKDNAKVRASRENSRAGD